MKFIPYGRQSINDEDLETVIEVLKSDFLTQGPKVREFEDNLKKKFGSEYGLCLNSATSALHAACVSLDVGSGDLVWTSPITFVSSANCALFCGARVDFVDVDKQTLNMSAYALEEKLRYTRLNNLQMPKVVIPVHMSGSSCNMKEIFKLSKEFNFKIIEDASHAVGAKYYDDYVGNCKYSDITVFSFHPVKIITTGEGGAALTNSQEYYRKMERFRSHGVTRDPEQRVKKKNDPWTYDQLDLGYNYRMTDISAALGISQLHRVDKWVIERHRMVDLYKRAFNETRIQYLQCGKGVYSSYHLFIVKLENRREAYDFLTDSGIGVNVHYMPVHLQPYYKELGFKSGDFPESEEVYEEILTLPLHPSLEETQQDYIIEKVKEISA